MLEADYANKSPQTFNVARAALRRFEGVLVEDGVITVPRTVGIKSRKIPKRLPKPVPEAEVSRLLSTVKNVQDKALIEILAGSGLRRSEAAGLTLGQITPDGILQVIGKGDKERQTFLTHSALDAVKSWILFGHMKAKRSLTQAEQEQMVWQYIGDNPDKGLFLGRDGEVKDLTYPGQWVYSRLKRYTDQAPHEFRHFWVTDLLNNGADLMAVMDAAGHESVATTRGYKKVLNRETSSLRARHSREQGRL